MPYKFAEIIDVKRIQTLMDDFYGATNIATAILELDGTILTASGWKYICTEFHRKNPETSRRCTESDTMIANQLLSGNKYAVYKCKNGLVDVATPITIETGQIATLFIGQFLTEPPDLDYFRRQAAEFGFDEATYMKALSEVAITDDESIKRTMDFLSGLASLLGEAGWQQTKEEEARRQLEIASKDIIDAQRRALQELSTPIIPVMDQVIVMPLIGSIDSMRARDIMRTLLEGIRLHRAKVAIIDITGIPIVDSGVAIHLNKTIQAARLKGVRTIVTGISDAVAETIVDLGIDWSGIETLRDLQTGLLVALQSLGFKLAR